MRKFFYMTLVAGLSFSSCNLADKDDYARVAEDMCGCVNSNSEEISQGMKTAIIDAAESNVEFEAAMDAYATANPEQAVKDGIVMMELGEKIEGCIGDLETKYKDLYSNESDEEIERRLMEALQKNKQCEWTHALVKLEMQGN